MKCIPKCSLMQHSGYSEVYLHTVEKEGSSSKCTVYNTKQASTKFSAYMKNPSPTCLWRLEYTGTWEKPRSPPHTTAMMIITARQANAFSTCNHSSHRRISGEFSWFTPAMPWPPHPHQFAIHHQEKRKEKRGRWDHKKEIWRNSFTKRMFCFESLRSAL